MTLTCTAAEKYTSPSVQYYDYISLINNNNNNNDDGDEDNDDDPWHYSPDGHKPLLIQFHSLS
jgi:hypothetical protein